MSADHTITTKNRTEEIAETTQKLLHDYFERSGSASLINRLAPDVLWFSEEESGGKEEAARYLTAWKEGFFNSYVESESYEAKSSTSPLLHLPPRQHRASSLKFYAASTTCAT